MVEQLVDRGEIDELRTVVEIGEDQSQPVAKQGVIVADDNLHLSSRTFIRRTSGVREFIYTSYLAGELHETSSMSHLGHLGLPVDPPSPAWARSTPWLPGFPSIATRFVPSL
jgi:hypothetical protein